MSLDALGETLDWPYLAKLEQGIGKSESTGIRGRWEFGCYLRDHVPRVFGPKVGPLQAIAAELGMSERELRYRRVFAETYPTETECRKCISDFGSWFEIVKRGLTRTAAPSDAVTPALPEGVYRTIAIDPPWPVQKIEREQRPKQGTWLDYPTMTLEQIANLPIPDIADSDGCHIYLWVTHKVPATRAS